MQAHKKMIGITPEELHHKPEGCVSRGPGDYFIEFTLPEVCRSAHAATTPDDAL
jgi:hypothetical protein